MFNLMIYLHSYDYSTSKSIDYSKYLFYCLTDGWTIDDLIYEWKTEEPVQIVDNLNLPRFKLEHYDTDSCNTQTNTGKFMIIVRI